MARSKGSLKKTRPKFEKDGLLDVLWAEIINGVSRYEIHRKLETDGYKDDYGFETSGLSRSSRYNYVQEAYDRCEVELKENRDKMRDVLWQRILSVYEDAMKVHDRQSALRALDMIGKYGGLQDDTLNKIEIDRKNEKIEISFGIDK